MEAECLADMTFDEVEALVRRGRVVALVPVGSVEPHGPHLPLGTDTTIGESCARRAVPHLAGRGIIARVAPSVPYGVTEFARGFAGAISVPADVLTSLLRAIVERLLASGFRHVCLVNNHLEPAHDVAVRAGVAGLAPGLASVACPLSRRWARTLSDEFKRGDCHAGRYETSLVLAAGARVVDPRGLAPLTISLSDGIRAGKTSFAAMGMERAYTGDPAAATAEEGEGLYLRLVEMIATEIEEALALGDGG